MIHSGEAKRYIEAIALAYLTQHKLPKASFIATGSRCLGETNSSLASLHCSAGIGKASNNALVLSAGIEHAGIVLEPIRAKLNPNGMN